MKVGDSKTVNGITVVVHHVAEATVYYARFRGGEWDCNWWERDEWPLWRMPREEFEELWETER